MKRPGSPADPEVAAMLRQFLDQRTPPPLGAVRRPAGPPPPRVEIGYLLDLPMMGRSGNPFLEIRQRVVEAGKPPTPWEPCTVSAERAASCADAEDRRVVALLAETASALEKTGQVGLLPRESSTRIQLTRSLRERILPAVARAGRLVLRLPGASKTLRLREEPWVLRLKIDLAQGTDAWEVRGLLRSGATLLPLAEIEVIFDGGMVLFQGEIGQIDDGGASSWLGLLREHRRVGVSPGRRAAFLEEIFSLPTPPPLDLPDAVTIAEHQATARPRLYIHAPASEAITSTALFAEHGFDYDGLIVPARRAGKVAFDGARMRLIRRDPALETAARTRLDELGLQPIPRVSPAPPPEGAHLQLPAARLPAIVEALLAEDWKVEANGAVYRRSTGSDTEVKSSGVDWFELRGAVHFDGMRAPLPAVLEALRRGQRAVVLDDGTLGIIPEEWLKRNGLVARLGVAKGDTIRFRRSQIALLDELVVTQPNARVDAVFAEARLSLGTGGAIAPAEPPASFHGELRAYQREGLGWLRSLERSGFGGCLADDMGLGKTVQVLALLAGRRGKAGKPSLVVAPRSLLFNWKREAERFAPDLRVLEHAGGDRRAPGVQWDAIDLVLTTYGTMRRDAEALARVPLDYLILDEAQAIKNGASETSRAARTLDAERRLALSGTPIENHLGELWSIFEFLNPGILGKSATFEAAATNNPTPEAIAVLGKAVAPFLLRRTKREVAPDLPERLEETWVCELGPAERAFYDELKRYYRGELLRRVERDGLGSSRVHVLEALLRLRQAACHPGLVDPKRARDPSAKLDALVPKLVELRESGQKALVFSQFTSLLDLLRPMLDAEGLVYEHLDGKTQDRQARVERFQSDPGCGLFLISLKAGGVGLNLTAAEYVFLLDPWWNPAAEAQAIDRAHRIGQQRSVFAYRLLAKDTVEERIAELKRQKQALAESVIRGDGAPMRELSVEDLELLLS